MTYSPLQPFLGCHAMPPQEPLHGIPKTAAKETSRETRDYIWPVMLIALQFSKNNLEYSFKRWYIQLIGMGICCTHQLLLVNNRETSYPFSWWQSGTHKLNKCIEWRWGAFHCILHVQNPMQQIKNEKIQMQIHWLKTKTERYCLKRKYQGNYHFYFDHKLTIKSIFQWLFHC